MFTTFVLSGITLWLSWSAFKIWYVTRDDSYLDLLESMGYNRDEVAYWTPILYNTFL